MVKVCTCVCVHVSVCAYVCVPMCVYVRVCVYMYVCAGACHVIIIVYMETVECASVTAGLHDHLILEGD